MKRKILFYYTILILIAITVTGIFTSQMTRKVYKEEVEDRLLTSAKIIQFHILSNIEQGILFDYDNLAVSLAQTMNSSGTYESSIHNSDFSDIRITFIGFDGTVLGESQGNPGDMENHSTRKEVSEAILGEIGKDIRYSNTMGINFLYIAIPYEPVNIIIRVSVPLLQIQNIDKIIWIYTIAGVFSGLSITLLLAIKFSTSMTNPVKELIAVSGEIAKGNYKRRVRINSDDEMSELADTFNIMATELERTVNDLTDKNIKVKSILNSMNEGILAVDKDNKIILINDVTRKMFDVLPEDTDVLGTNLIESIRNTNINRILRKTLESGTSKSEEIRIGPSSDKYIQVYTNPIFSFDNSTKSAGAIAIMQDITNVKKLEQIRTEFVSNVTHELKTPLTSIRGFIETLRAGAIEDKEVSDQFLEIIDIEADRLFILINDILQLSEIESMQKDTHITKVNLKGLFTEILPIIQKAAEDKKINIIEQIDDKVMLNANGNRIKQLLFNLIDNAVKYNKENGFVLVKGYKTEGCVVIKVKDNGIGIPEEHHARIFERFYRVDKGRSRNLGGTGLGLSIVKHIVNLYNGNIQFESIPGQGTEFTIKLPA